MITCNRCKFYHKVWGWFPVCGRKIETGSVMLCSIQNQDGNCIYYEAKFPYNLFERKYTGTGVNDIENFYEG